MADPTNDPPPQPKTAKIPEAEKGDILLAELKVLLVQGLGALDAKMAIGLRDIGSKVDAVEAKVDRLEANYELQSGQLEVTQKSVDLLFGWKGDVDQRLKNNSQRARAPSSFDMDQDAKLAQTLVQLDEEKKRREQLEANAATKEDLKVLADAQTSDIVGQITKAAEKSPTVRSLLWALAGLAFMAINAATTYLAARGH